MFSKFNMTISNGFYNRNINPHLTTGERIYQDYTESSKKCLQDFIKNNDTIDGTALKEHWFNMTKADVFLSHSHNDISKVKAFAGWLYDVFGLTAFIDSCVWGYCDNLLRDIDNTYCKNKKDDNYNYRMRNYTTSHVHMMLSIALSQMIDQTECVIFFNTPNSINWVSDLNSIKNKSEKKTLSPWIYHELAMTSLIRTQSYPRQELLHEGVIFEKNSEIHISHDVTKYLEEMKNMNDGHLSKWENNWQRVQDILEHRIDGSHIYYDKYKNKHPLDILYDIYRQ